MYIREPASSTDSRDTTALRDPPKSNWAQKLDTPPFVAYPSTGGITFTFGGLKINADGQVIGTDWQPIPGLYAAGENAGGMSHHGLAKGILFGRLAGNHAAAQPVS